MQPPGSPHVDVDMVPLIDIVTLLLMFLIFVGDMAKSAAAIQMKLPHADQAVFEKGHDINTEGRVVVQLAKGDERRRGAGRDPNRYYAVVNNVWYELLPKGESANLLKFLKEYVAERELKGAVRDEKGGVKMPVKLRIPLDTPMLEVQRLVMLCARANFVNIHYAAQGKMGR